MEVTRQTIAKALAVVFVFNLIVMGGGALYSAQQVPPIPQEVVGPDGNTVATQEQVQAGKVVFQQNSLMNHGSILGNGAYYGVDYTADTLDLKVEYMREYYAGERYDAAYSALGPAEQGSVDRLVRDDLDEQFTEGTETIEYSAAEAYAHEQIREEYVERYHEGELERGVPADFVAPPRRRASSPTSRSGRRGSPTPTARAPIRASRTSGRTTPPRGTRPPARR